MKFRCSQTRTPLRRLATRADSRETGWDRGGLMSDCDSTRTILRPSSAMGVVTIGALAAQPVTTSMNANTARVATGIQVRGFTVSTSRMTSLLLRLYGVNMMCRGPEAKGVQDVLNGRR